MKQRKPWPPQKHDRAYRRFFSHREMVDDLVRGFIDEPWVKNLDFDHMEQVSDVFVDEKWERRDADTIWRIRWKPGGEEPGGEEQPPIYVAFIFEFLSRPDSRAAVRLMGYESHFYQRLIANGLLGESDLLPLVIPIVLYNGDTLWEAHDELSNIIVKLPGLEHWVPCFRFKAIDIKRLGPAELAKMLNRAAALFRMEQSRELDDILAGLRQLKEIVQDPDDRIREVYVDWLSDILLGMSAPPKVVAAIRAKEDFSMLIDNLIEWKTKFQEESQQAGVRLGELAMLRRQLERRFGPLSADVVDRLDRADVDQLLELGDRVLTAKTIEEIFDKRDETVK